MPFDDSCHLWASGHEAFFRDREIVPLRQTGRHCVSTVLAMLVGTRPEDFQGRMNTQDPVSWSDALKPFGVKLADISGPVDSGHEGRA
jgi:hypothetical protein